MKKNECAKGGQYDDVFDEDVNLENLADISSQRPEEQKKTTIRRKLEALLEEKQLRKALEDDYDLDD